MSLVYLTHIAAKHAAGRTPGRTPASSPAIPPTLPLAAREAIEREVAQCGLADPTEMVEEMVAHCRRCLIKPGTMVGIQAAQSICERTSQMLLNTFHLAGAGKSVSGGVRRLRELLDGSASPARAWRAVDARGDPVDARALAAQTLRAFVKETRVSGRVIDLTVTARVNLRKVAGASWAGPRAVSLRVSRNEDPARRLRTALDSHVAGLRGVTDAREDGMAFGGCATLTLGDFACALPGADVTRLWTTDVNFIARSLGIEAAREYLAREITRTLEAEGIHIAPRHISLLVDNMTRGGAVNGSRYGAIAASESVLLKATFQQATETFAAAATGNVTDYLRDVSSQIMLGKLPSIGNPLVQSRVAERAEERAAGCIAERAAGCIAGSPPPYASPTPASPSYASPTPASPAYAPASPSYAPAYAPAYAGASPAPASPPPFTLPDLEL